ncbi:tetratricopeptide repeat protein [Pelobium manganitolerans]|nr:tetratricopeptide repeat protein [Pelobium manganitolerans]
MMLKRGFFSASLVLLCLFAVAQKKKGDKEQRVFVLSGNILSAADSNRVLQLYYNGLREKVVDNATLAIERFMQAVKTDPLHHPSYFELGQIYFKKGDLEKARLYAEKAVAIKTDNQWYWLLVANIYQQQQDYKLLNYALDELLQLAPDKLDYRFDKANALFMLGKFDESLRAYKALEDKIGLTDEVLQGRQRIYLKKGQFDKAVADLKELISNNPAEVRNYLYLGDLYYSEKKMAEALEVYRQAKQLDENNPFTRMAIAQILESQKKTDEAFEEVKAAFLQPSFGIDQKVKMVIKYFEAFPDQKAIARAEALAQAITEAHPTDPKAFSLYGDVLFQKADYPNAKKAYQQALALNKNVYLIWDQLLRINLYQNDAVALVKDGEEAISYFPNQYGLYFYVGIGYQLQKKSAQAITYLNNALAYDIDNVPLKAQIYSSLGDAYEAQKMYKESVAAYEKSLVLEPENTYTLNNYAYYLSLRNEDLAKAEKMSIKSNQLEKDNASFQDTYAWILFKLKKYAEAKEWMQKAIRNNPNSPVQYEHLGDILFKLGQTAEALENWSKSLKLNADNPLLKRKINEKKYIE